jgi:hypothetical protein
VPTVVKSSSQLAKLGDISTFNVSTTAVSADPADSTGSVPTLTTTFANGTDTEYLIGEDLTVSSPSIGSFEGKVVSRSKASNSALYNASVDSIMVRLNSELRTYPLADYGLTSDNAYMPLYCLEYWTQQCGLFYTKVTGDVLLYQSGYGHFGLFARDYTRPLRSNRIVNAGGTAGSMTSRYGRIMSGFGYDFDAIATFPKDRYLATPVPDNTERLVFGVDVDLVGTGRTAELTWYLKRSGGAKPAIRLSVASDGGFTLKSSDDNGNSPYTTRITSVVPKGDMYSAYTSVSRSGSNTRLTLKVFDSAGVLKDTQTVLFASNIKGNLSLTSVKFHGNTGGSGSELAYSSMFVSRMKADPAERFADAKALTPGVRGDRFMVGFSGNVWEHIKQYCSLYHLDIGFVNGKLTIGPRKRDVVVGASLSEGTTTVQDREQARNVEVVNNNHKATGITPTVLWKADSVYQVAVGEVQEFTVQTPHSILETSQPVCVSGISPFPYKTGAGQYVVTGSDGYIVSPTFWADQGGKITTDITDVEGEIKVTIKGPDFDSIRAPYRISEGDAGRPALYVTGLGILSDPKTLKVGTGKAKAAKDVGVTLDSPFIGSAEHAYDAAVYAARTFATPEVTVSLAEPIAYDGVSKLGTYPVGAVVKMDGNILRVVSAGQSPTVLSGSASQHNTLYQLKRSFSGMTIAQQKAYYAGKTIRQVNIKPIRKVN